MRYLLLLLVMLPVWGQVEVIESEVRAQLVNGMTQVSLTLQNSAPSQAKGKLVLEYLGTDDRKISVLSIDFDIPAGKTRIEKPFPIPVQIQETRFIRLKYQLQFPGQKPQSVGIVDVNQIAEHAIRVLAIPLGERNRLHVQAVHPSTERPQEGVRIRVQYRRGQVEGKTNALGEAILEVPLGKDESEVFVRAAHGDFQNSTRVGFDSSPRVSVLIHTDKPMYQAGQKIRARALLRSGNRKVVADAMCRVRLLTPSGKEVDAQTVKSSRFGIVGMDFLLPESAIEGQYRIVIFDEKSGVSANQGIQVRKYVMPEFRVSVRPDRRFYPKDSTVVLDLGMTESNGRPIGLGKFKIQAMQWGRELKRSFEGSFGKEGRARMEIPVKELIDGLDYWQSFPDLEFKLYATHPVTAREELKTFHLKLCEVCSHSYVAGVRGSDIIIGSRYVDGSPVVGETVEVRDGERVIGSLKTNRYGLAKLDRVGVKNFKVVRGGRETPGQIGSLAGETLELRTDRNLYKAGEAIGLSIETPRPDLPVRILAYSMPSGELISSQRLAATNGKAELTIPYDVKFGSVVAIRAVALHEAGLSAFRMVVYPAPNPFPLTLRTDKKIYRPNENMELRLSGSRTETAFGVAVVDEGVFDRKLAYTIQPFSYFKPALGVPAEYTLEDLVSMRPEQIDEESQVFASLVLSRIEPRGIRLPRKDDISEAYREWMRNAVKALDNQLSGVNSKSPDLPRDMAGLQRKAPKFVNEWRDPWNQPFRYEFKVRELQTELHLWSSGPDRKFGNDDDLRTWPIQRPWFGRLSAAIQMALDEAQDYPVSAEAVEILLAQRGISLARYRDPFGEFLRIKPEISKNAVTIKIFSAGPDTKWQTGDDLLVWSSSGSYFGTQSEVIEEVLKRRGALPQTEDAFIALMQREGHDFRSWRDPIGRPYRVILRKAPLLSRDAVSYPIRDLEKMNVIEIRTSDSGSGELLKAFSLASDKAWPSQGKGRLQGRVHLQVGSELPSTVNPVAGAKVLLDGTYSTVTDKEGRYQFDDVPAGSYKLEVIEEEPHGSFVKQIQIFGETATIADLGVGPSYRAMHPNREFGNGMQFAMSGGRELEIRVRDEFPETAFWIPELESDGQGNALAKLTLPGSVSTWRVAVIGSTLDGRVVETSTKVPTRLQLEIDLELPTVLTEGDRVELEVPILSETKRDARGSLRAVGSGGIAVDRGMAQTVAISKGAGIARIGVRAAKRSERAELKLTGQFGNLADSIARHLVVEPNGERITSQVSGTTMRIEVPADAIPGTLKAKVSVEGSILAMLAAQVESRLTRSYYGGPMSMAGAAYMNIYFLDALHSSGIRNLRLEELAKRNLEATNRQLIENLNVVALETQKELKSAYVADYLKAAKRHVMLDSSLQRIVETAQLATDGAWIPNDATPSQLAEYILYQLSLSRPAPVDAIAERLRGMAIEDRLWRNTSLVPDQKWGRGGEYRTTALALTALARHGNTKGRSPSQDPLLQRAADYLMQSRDEYGTWLKPEVSADVIVALIEVAGPLHSVPYSIPIRVNGQSLTAILVTDLDRPTELDLTSYLKPGQRTEIVLSPPQSSHPARATLSASWYEPWKEKAVDEKVGVSVSFSKTEAKRGEIIDTKVQIRSPLDEGLVAVDVGLPPGAEVELVALKKLGSVYRADVTPTGVRLVVWPRLGAASEYQFQFRPRLAIEGFSRPSSLIGLMNRELKATQGPVKFKISDER